MLVVFRIAQMRIPLEMFVMILHISCVKMLDSTVREFDLIELVHGVVTYHFALMIFSVLE